MVLSYGTLVWYVTVWYVFLNNFNIISEHVKNESLKNFPRNENFIKENEKLRRKTKHLKVTNVNDLKRAYVLMARLANTPTVCSLTQWQKPVKIWLVRSRKKQVSIYKTNSAPGWNNFQIKTHVHTVARLTRLFYQQFFKRFVILTNNQSSF